jgi:methanogenic corrinoid protein MtbC1
MDKDFSEKFADLKEDEVLEIVRQGVKNGIDPREIFKACQEAMIIVGERFEKGVYFVSDLMMAGVIFKQINEILKPLLTGEGGGKTAGKVVIGTVAGDIHDIGKDLVVGLLEANNYEVFDLGVDQKKEVFINKLRETGAPVLALSGLLTIAFDSMKETINFLKAEGLREKVKVMIGGGPVDQGVCDYTGADAWGSNAQKAVKLCKEWIGG